jgi:hypothetical protein
MDANRRNYYRILHVQPDAPLEVIRSSYRTIMQRLKAHPDLGGDNRAASLINEAYAVLTDPEQRKAYDEGFRPRYQRTAADGAAVVALGRLPEGLQTGTFVVCAFCREPFTRANKVRADTLCTGCGSPLYPAARPGETTRGRTLPRLERNHPAVLFTRWPQDQGHPAETRDLSPHGVRLLTAESLQAGAIVKLDSDVCRAVVRVTSARRDPGDGRYTIGGAFVTVLFSQPRGGFVSTRV